MTTYQAADTHDNTGALVALDPQPSSEGIQTADRVYCAGAAYDAGADFIILRFKGLLSPAQLAALYAALGLTSSVDNEGTFHLPQDIGRTTWGDYNGRAIRPESPKFRMGFYRDVEIMIGELVEIT